MNLHEQTNRIKQMMGVVNEEMSKSFRYALRRNSWDDKELLHKIKYATFVLYQRFSHTDEPSEDFITKVINFVTSDFLDPSVDQLTDDEYLEVFDEISNYFKEKYTDVVKDVFKNINFKDDKQTYCFIKHLEKDYHNNPKNYGFGDCRKGWKEFISVYGSNFIDLDWGQLHEKLNSLPPNTDILIKEPGYYENYYFTIKRV